MGDHPQAGARPEGYADPQDLEFSKAAAEKEERLDEALASGKPIPPDEPPDQRPRASSKADPKSQGSTS